LATLCSVTDPQPKVDIWPKSLSVGNGGFFGSVQFYFGQNHIYRSVLASPHDEDVFRFFLRDKNIKLAVETGTFKGTATALLAHYADKVVTIDTKNYVDKYPFWIEYGVYNKIESYIVDSEEDKVNLLADIDFDFAFIDGDHSVKGVELDFDCVEKCGRVLFHDYYERHSCFDMGCAQFQGIVPLVDSLPDEELTISRPFAYWERG
jgi:hypothetical protein